MSGRFDYVKYDQRAVNQQNHIKTEVEGLELYLDKFLPNSRAKDLALQALEEFYMWCGKAIRDDQVKRNGSAEPQEQRSNS